ncbi:enhancer of split m7 protein-like [Sitodiplosis mosellana]|uniref:enhancer of split m7 protein-like n=1 Tax=Sitodiplosis mosellana TaxID=263140 RepID=UPI002443FA3F|nr:enhancer of split m7 protein-like [Sitodiplosis mosellana]
MAPNQNYILTDASGEPVSRTYQYRKVMKPMLERKRRARINRCLDELKELMTNALQTEGENVAKLEKADILELTVRHLHTLRRQNVLGARSDNSYAEKFKAGFRHCAAEVSSFLNVVDQETSVPIIKHLNSCMNHMERNAASTNQGAIHMHQQYPASPMPPQPQRPAIQIQSPNQINAHAVAAAAAAAVAVHHHRQSPSSTWSSKGRSPVPMMPQPKHQMMYPVNHMYSNRSPNSTPDCHMESSTRVNTPPISPKIDIDDSSVWRPW